MEPGTPSKLAPLKRVSAIVVPFAGSLTGVVLGMAGALIVIQLFLVLDEPWVYRMAQVSAALGLWIVREWDFGCFPTQAGIAEANRLFTLAAGLQWAGVGFIVDLIRAALRRKAASD